MKPEISRQLIFAGALASLLLFADTVWATQTHGQPEGLFVHQMAHIFFIISMGSLDFWLRQRNLIQERGWKYIQLAAVLFILWNIDALLVHFLDEHLHILGITKIGLWHIQIDSQPGQNSIAVFYYLLKLDHLLCVPAMFFLYFGLQTILKNTSASNANRLES
jgi:hypothetical protein